MLPGLVARHQPRPCSHDARRHGSRTGDGHDHADQRRTSDTPAAERDRRCSATAAATATATITRHRRAESTAATSHAADDHAGADGVSACLAAAVGPGRADRLLRRAGRDRRAAGACRATRPPTRCATCRRSPTSTRVGALGYRSIGDAATGFEHFINYAFINDDKLLDPTAPESLVYQVDGDARTLVSAMFIASDTPIDDPELVDFARAADAMARAPEPVLGARRERPAEGDGRARVDPATPARRAPSTPAATTRWCTSGSRRTSAARSRRSRATAPVRPMPPTAPAPTSARTSTRDGGCHGDVATPALRPEPADRPRRRRRRDPEQQAFAENLVAATVRDLPQWADLDVVEAAGFHSIGDGGTGHEHYIQWDWIDDDVWLDPDYPESLVFEPQPDGSKKLVSAMFMLPSGHRARRRARLGRRADAVARPRRSVLHRRPGRSPGGGAQAGRTARASAPFVDFPLSPMIHVWITPTPCGPFAALEGIGGGQVAGGRGSLCDHAHGSH